MPISYGPYHVFENATCNMCYEIAKAYEQNILSKFKISGELANVDQLMENVQFVPAAGLGYAQR